jgi:hypothetical protein
MLAPSCYYKVFYLTRDGGRTGFKKILGDHSLKYGVSIDITVDFVNFVGQHIKIPIISGLTISCKCVFVLHFVHLGFLQMCVCFYILMSSFI